MNDVRLYGSNTQAAIANFDVSGETVDHRIIEALAHIKACCAIANSHADVGRLDREIAAAIVGAAEEVATGKHRDQFPVDVFQTGSGTSTNMNVNEVLASIASSVSGLAVHPNDHVNMSQSTNDTFPTAIRVAVSLAIRDQLLPALGQLADALADKAVEFGDVVKPGRTHLMDATPVMLGDEFGGYAAQIRESIERIASAQTRLVRLPLGGTATGNGLNTPPGHAAMVRELLTERTGVRWQPPLHHFAVQGGQDALVEASAQLRGAALAMFKIANDIRLMASGPRTGLGELMLTELQPGSSIMPGKTNPVICEVVIQVCAQVVGNDTAIAFAGSRGELELNVYLPVMARNLLESVDLLAGSCTSLTEKTIVGLRADSERCKRLAELSPAVATALNLEIGYDRAASVVKSSLASGRSLVDEVVETGLMSRERAAELLSVEAMARGTQDHLTAQHRDA